jgi:hypothetical protein
VIIKDAAGVVYGEPNRFTVEWCGSSVEMLLLSIIDCTP